MSHTLRNKPHKKLKPSEEKFVERNKFKHGVQTKRNIYELEYSQSAKKESKKRKHKIQRKQEKEVINDIVTDKG